MMHHFSLKSLTFYGVAIGSVVTLFSLTTAYGEANLRPSTKIAGRYRLHAQTLPGCLKTEALVLTVQQSGIYLNATLAEPGATPAPSAKLKPSLHGFWRSQQLTLAGRPTALKACQPTATEVQIQGTIAQKLLKGTIGLGTAAPADFTAERLAESAHGSGH
jgi:hypothetical protein